MNLLADWTTQKDTLMKIAAAMPEDKLGYKPTPPQRDATGERASVNGQSFLGL